jgi:hypothetical protein
MPAPDTMLLDYYLATQPQPLQAGDETIQANGTINVHIVSPTSPVAYANEITIAVPVGTGGLFQQPPACTINTGKWVLTSQKKVKGKTIGLIADQDYSTFTINCQTPGDYNITYNLVVALVGAVTAVEDSYQLQVLENSGTTSDPSTFTPKKGMFTLSVVPPQLYLSNLVAYATGSPTVPKTEFINGADINLSWESNGTWFQVYKKGDTSPFFSGSGTTCTLSGGVSTATTFFLMASMTGNPNQDQGGFATVFLYDAITITISNPVLTPTSVNTSAGVTVGTNLTVNGTANVTGQTTLGAATANTLTTTGLATLATATIPGTLGVTGATTLASATVNNGLTVTGGATINGGLTGTGSNIGMLTGAIAVSPGGYSAKTDGFVIGVASWPSGDWDHLSVAWISGATDGIWMCATGGNHGAFNNNWDKWRTSNGNSFVMPVRRGAGWSVGVQQFGSNEVAAPTAFYWFPLGANSGMSTYERISDEMPHPPHGRPRGVARVSKSKEAYVADLVDIIGEIAPKPISPKLHKRLVHVLTKLNSDEYEEREG